MENFSTVPWSAPRLLGFTAMSQFIIYLLIDPILIPDVLQRAERTGQIVIFPLAHRHQQFLF